MFSNIFDSATAGTLLDYLNLRDKSLSEYTETYSNVC